MKIVLSHVGPDGLNAVCELDIFRATAENWEGGLVASCRSVYAKTTCRKHCPIGSVSSVSPGSLEDLGFPTRLSNCLKRAGIFTPGQLLLKTKRDLTELRGFGDLSLREVERRLADSGLVWPIPSPKGEMSG